MGGWGWGVGRGRFYFRYGIMALSLCFGTVHNPFVLCGVDRYHTVSL